MSVQIFTVPSLVGFLSVNSSSILTLLCYEYLFLHLVFISLVALKTLTPGSKLFPTGSGYMQRVHNQNFVVNQSCVSDWKTQQ